MHLLILTVFGLLLACIADWLRLRRKFRARDPAAQPQYRRYQVLIGLIALLTILLALLIIFSSDPGNPDDYLMSL
jgi:uncharacterized membrane protein YidH (DUF202 family)